MQYHRSKVRRIGNVCEGSIVISTLARWIVMPNRVQQLAAFALANDLHFVSVLQRQPVPGLQCQRPSIVKLAFAIKSGGFDRERLGIRFGFLIRRRFFAALKFLALLGRGFIDNIRWHELPTMVFIASNY